MSESKEEKYLSLIKEAKALVSTSEALVSNLANTCALIKEKFQHHWVGLYLIDKQKNELYLGPFQGPVACTRIAFGKGVCGLAWKEQKTIIVPNVHEFPGHIACSSLSNSEIVVPLVKEGKVVAVLDIDSTDFAHFDHVDQMYLEELVQVLTPCFC